MAELFDLTLNGVTYDSFPDKKARASIAEITGEGGPDYVTEKIPVNSRKGYLMYDAYDLELTGVDAGKQLTISNTSRPKVYCGSKNVLPVDNEFKLEKATNVTFDIPLPPGGYLLSCNFTCNEVFSKTVLFRLNGTSASGIGYANSACTSSYGTGDFKPPDLHGYEGRYGRRVFTKEPITNMDIWAAKRENQTFIPTTITNFCMVPIPAEGSENYTYVGDHIPNSTYTRNSDGEYVNALGEAPDVLDGEVPTYIFTDDYSSFTVSYDVEVPVVHEGSRILPLITENDDGKVLKVVDGGPAWAEDAPVESGLPSIGSNDNGKVLTVSGGEAVWGNVGASGEVETIPAPPPHYLDLTASPKVTYLKDRVDLINSRMKSACANGDAFIFITDQHLENNPKTGNSRNAKNGPSLVKYIGDNTKVRKLFSGGDVGLIYAQQSSYHDLMADAFVGDAYYIMGNHEYDVVAGTPRLTDADLCYIHDVNKPDQIGNAARHYYYVDNPQQKLRYVVVNGFDHNAAAVSGGTGDQGATAYDIDTQIAWLDSTAFNVESGWGIILLCHCIYEGDKRNGYGGGDKIFDAVNNYSGPGEIIAVFHGHTHKDMIHRTPNGIPLIGTTADKQESTTSGEFLVDRTRGTINEHAFDVVVIDRTTRKIHCVRIGAMAIDGDGKDSTKQVEERVVDFRPVT